MRIVLLLLLATVLIPLCSASAQTTRETSVMLSATVTRVPSPRITLAWNREANAITYRVARRERGETNWYQMAALDGTVDTYTDSTVQPGMMYEYRLIDTLRYITDTTQVNRLGFGYIATGIDVPPVHMRGNVLLLVDSTMATPLASELARHQATLEKEGWNVTRRDVERAELFNKEAVQRTKAVIREWHTQNGATPGTVFIIGRVPVPYSGMFYLGQSYAPDGHGDHKGAWPADLYYGDMGFEANWTDNLVDTSASREATRNRAGDGKFDNFAMLNYVDLRIGRVDFYDMGLFKKGTQTDLEAETEMLRAYLNKDYAYRTGQTEVILRGLVDDNFGYFSGEAFARSGWMNFAPIVGRDSVVSGDWFTMLPTQPYMWAYGCGGGTYTGADGIGSTSNFVETPLNAVFTLLFGSYFGDWDSPNNFLRAGLASASPILTCAWSGRPYWFFHTMAMGESIGDATMLSQNYKGYIGTSFATAVYPAMMGDPTLRMRYTDIPEPRNISIHMPCHASQGVDIEWDEPSGGSVDGYYVYRQLEGGAMQLLNSQPLTGTSFNDTAFVGRTMTYTVRATKLVRTPSGTFYDLSNRVTAQATVTLDVEDNDAPAIAGRVSAICHPNPARESVAISLSLASRGQVDVGIFSMTGQRVQSLESRMLSAGTYGYSWNLLASDGTRVPAGVYYVRIMAGGESLVKKVVVLE
jgi:hypothetical protein